MTQEELTTLLDKCAIAHQMTGSRYICNPAPMDTDEDHIALMVKGYEAALELAGFVMNSQPEHYEGMSDFLAYRLGEYNVIVTFAPDFYRRFVDATKQAKAANLLQKSDRISLFQRVLYDVPELSEIPL